MVAMRCRGLTVLPVHRVLNQFADVALASEGLVRRFVADAQLTREPVSFLREHALRDLIGRAIRDGRLVGVVRSRVPGAAPEGKVLQRRLVQDIDQRGRLHLAGRRYRLVADVDWAKLPSRDSYEVVRREDARRVLGELAKLPGTAADLPALLAKASDRLSPDWRPPVSAPDGLVLLRHVPTFAGGSRSEGPAITPSMMKAMVDQSALTIHVVDLKKKPQQGLAFQIQAPDGTSVAGRLDEQGRAKAPSTCPGVFGVRFPELDGADWDGDGALALSPETSRSEASRHGVEQGERLPSIARAHGFRRWETVWDFVGNAALRELRGTAHILLPEDEVSIPSKLERQAEVPGGAAEYVVRCACEVLRVRFAGVKPTQRNEVTFKATPDVGASVEGPLPKSRRLEIELPPGTTTVHVELFRQRKDDGKPFAAYDFAVGALDPSETTSGIKARLQNLGFYRGPLDGNLDDGTRTAIAHFRWAQLRDRKDAVDADFLAALKSTHGR
jgi:N-acetylmuramoyl-L-alanine amidase